MIGVAALAAGPLEHGAAAGCRPGPDAKGSAGFIAVALQKG